MPLISNVRQRQMQGRHCVAATEVKSSALSASQCLPSKCECRQYHLLAYVRPRQSSQGSVPFVANAGARRTTCSSLVRPDIRSKHFAPVVVNTRAFGQKLWHLYVHFVRPSPVCKARTQGSSFVPSARFRFRETPSVLSVRAHATSAISVRVRAAA
jgi:hypothetical protein